jgi:hypothetical protein
MMLAMRSTAADRTLDRPTFQHPEHDGELVARPVQT